MRVLRTILAAAVGVIVGATVVAAQDRCRELSQSTDQDHCSVRRWRDDRRPCPNRRAGADR